MVRVKICGITNEHNALHAVNAGASAVGFVFYKKSPRYVSPSKVRKIVESLPPFVTPVAVFVNAKEGMIKDVLKFTRINTVQLHGDEDPKFCQRLSNFNVIKAFRVDKEFSLKQVKQFKVDAYLFDSFQDGVFGGTGKSFQWDLFRGYNFDKPMILSGGLDASNVIEGVNITRPFAVDISSSIEHKPGIKNHKAIDEFMDVIKMIQPEKSSEAAEESQKE